MRKPTENIEGEQKKKNMSRKEKRDVKETNRKYRNRQGKS